MHADTARGYLQQQAAQLDGVAIEAIAAARQGAHARQQFGQHKRLHQVVVCAAVQATQALFQRIAGAEDQHRQAGCAQPGQQIEAIAVRQAQVQQHQFAAVVLDAARRIFQAAHPHHLHALVAQGDAHAVAQVHVVFYQQYLHVAY